MTGPSDSLDDLEGDIRHLSTLILTIYDVATERPMPEDAGARITMQQVLDLLWIARDMAEKMEAAASACHSKVLAERKAT